VTPFAYAGWNHVFRTVAPPTFAPVSVARRVGFVARSSALLRTMAAPATAPDRSAACSESRIGFKICCASK
jgi:hypothetical protein